GDYRLEGAPFTALAVVCPDHAQECRWVRHCRIAAQCRDQPLVHVAYLPEAFRVVGRDRLLELPADMQAAAASTDPSRLQRQAPQPLLDFLRSSVQILVINVNRQPVDWLEGLHRSTPSARTTLVSSPVQ